jgi:hypothetical protein
MPEPAADAIVQNLIEALERLREDLDRMELWPQPWTVFNVQFRIIARASSTFWTRN